MKVAIGGQGSSRNLYIYSGTVSTYMWTHGEFEIYVAVLVLLTCRKYTRQYGSFYLEFWICILVLFLRAWGKHGEIEIHVVVLVLRTSRKYTRQYVLRCCVSNDQVGSQLVKKVVYRKKSCDFW